MKNLFFLLALLTLCCWSTAAVAQDVDCAEQCLCCECDEGDEDCLEECDCVDEECNCADLAGIDSNQSLQEDETEYYFEEPSSIVYVSYWPSAFVGAYIIFGGYPYYWYGGYYHRYHYYFYHGHRYWIHHHYWRHHRPSYGHPHPAHWSGGHGHGKAHGKGDVGYHGNKAPHKQAPSHKGQAPSYGKKKGANSKGQVPIFKKQASSNKQKFGKPSTSHPVPVLGKPVQKNHKSQPSSYRSHGRGGGSRPAYRSSSRSGGSRPANRSSGRGRGRGRR